MARYFKRQFVYHFPLTACFISIYLDCHAILLQFILCCLYRVLLLLYFFIYRSLHCHRITIHIHMFISFVIKFVIVIVMVEPGVTKRSSGTYKDVVSINKKHWILWVFLWTSIKFHHCDASGLDYLLILSEHLMSHPDYNEKCVANVKCRYLYS